MSFKELDKYKSLEDLRNFTETLINTTTALQLELQQTKDKLNHLEQITKFNTSPISIGSNEEELCKLEISRLYQAAKTGPLEFNEVKAFEIYVKSLMLIRGKSVNEEKKSKKEPALSNDQLIQLALQVVDDTNLQGEISS